MIADPINDTQCLGQLTTFARELSRTTLVRSVAVHLGSRQAVIKWLQSLPQSDDFGDEHVRFIACDVPQRARLFPDDPNCVERSLGALMLLEAIDPKTERALATVEKPLRHTGLVEKYGEHWRAVDLFPRRNAGRDFGWSDFGKDVLQGAHNYIGKPVLKFYLGDTGGKVADTLGDNEDNWIGRDKKKQTQKKNSPSPAGTQRVESPKPTGAKEAQPAGDFDFTRLLRARAKQEQTFPAKGGGEHGEKEQVPHHAAATSGRAAGAQAAQDRDRRDSHGARQERQEPKCFWSTLGR